MKIKLVKSLAGKTEKQIAVAASLGLHRIGDVTAGKGHKGQKARSGGGVRPGFEGGQMPLQRRVPKRGFNNIFATRYATINVKDLERFEDGAVVDAQALVEAGLLKKTLDGVKVLGRGELSKKLTVNCAAFSASAKEKIEKAGGKAEVK